jgi:hypothetical protein
MGIVLRLLYGGETTLLTIDLVDDFGGVNVHHLAGLLERNNTAPLEPLPARRHAVDVTLVEVPPPKGVDRVAQHIRTERPVGHV